MTIEAIRVSPSWLDLREAADGVARARELVCRLLCHVRGVRRWSIHDLAAGSGSMGRWLAPLLPGAQHWILHDQDADLLEMAAANVPGLAADGAEVAIETRVSDVTQLRTDDFAGATLITASALLDLLTRVELMRLIHACAGAGCPVLFALTVNGDVQLFPIDPLDARVAAAFDAHQRRTTARGQLLGSDAGTVAVEGFRRLGAEVAVARSPWCLGAMDNALAIEWLTGWVDAACEQEPELTPDAELYRRRRLGEAKAGVLAVTVGHVDLLVLP